MIFQREQWHKLLRSGLLTGILVSGIGMAQAAVLWDNGAVTSDTPRHCDTTPLQCGGNPATDNGFEIYDDFALAADGTITGFTYNDGFRNGPTTDYTSTNWTLWSGDPAAVAGPLASCSAVAVLSPDALGSTLFTVTGLSVNVSAGTYWLGTQNVLSNPDNITDRYFAAGNGLPGFEQSTTGISTQFGSQTPFAVAGDTAFSIEGTTPEPSTGLLLFAPLALFATWRLRRLVTPR